MGPRPRQVLPGITPLANPLDLCHGGAGGENALPEHEDDNFVVLENPRIRDAFDFWQLQSHIFLASCFILSPRCLRRRRRRRQEQRQRRLPAMVLPTRPSFLTGTRRLVSTRHCLRGCILMRTIHSISRARQYGRLSSTATAQRNGRTLLPTMRSARLSRPQTSLSNLDSH